MQPTVVSYQNLQESNLSSYAHLVVPSNTVDFNVPTRRLYVGGTGTLAVAMAGTNGFPTSKTFETLDLTANTLVSQGHGMIDGQIVVVTSATTLPAGLSANTLYYVVTSDVAAGSFILSATVGGAGVNITDVGTGVHTMHRIAAVHTAVPVGAQFDMRATRIFATGTSATLIIAYW